MKITILLTTITLTEQQRRKKKKVNGKGRELEKVLNCEPYLIIPYMSGFEFLWKLFINLVDLSRGERFWVFPYTKE